jgi:hypothetical protein
MNNTHVIGFCGKAGCGKGTASEIIYNYRTKMIGGCYNAVGVFPLADELKRIAREEFGWDGNKDEKGRKLLQTLGTECGRMYGGENFWVDKWQSAVYQWRCSVAWQSPNYPIVICDDVRFDNEAQHIRDIGGHICKIEGRAYDMGENNNHASEAGISNNLIDCVIDNTGDMDALENHIRNMLLCFGVING